MREQYVYKRASTLYKAAFKSDPGTSGRTKAAWLRRATPMETEPRAKRTGTAHGSQPPSPRSAGGSIASRGPASGAAPSATRWRRQKRACGCCFVRNPVARGSLHALLCDALDEWALVEPSPKSRALVSGGNIASADRSCFGPSTRWHNGQDIANSQTPNPPRHSQHAHPTSRLPPHEQRLLADSLC